MRFSVDSRGRFPDQQIVERSKSSPSKKRNNHYLKREKHWMIGIPHRQAESVVPSSIGPAPPQPSGLACIKRKQQIKSLQECLTPVGSICFKLLLYLHVAERTLWSATPAVVWPDCGSVTLGRHVGYLYRVSHLKTTSPHLLDYTAITRTLFIIK